MRVRKAVIPAAGFGTRFLPASKSQPKEMLPIVDKPTIQYVVEEAVDAGITDILMVIGKGKRAIAELFDRNFVLERELAEKQKTKALESVRRIASMADIHFVWQKELRGLGDAVHHARWHVGKEPFLVLLGDTLIGSNPPVTREMLEVFDRYREPVVALEQVPRDKIGRYGIIRGNAIQERVYLIEDLVEKPEPEDAPSDLAIAGRYVFTAEIFEHIANTTPGKNDEIQITDAMRRMVGNRAMYGVRFNGQRYDIGNKLDFLRTNIEFALARDDLKDDVADFIRRTAEALEGP